MQQLSIKHAMVLLVGLALLYVLYTRLARRYPEYANSFIFFYADWCGHCKRTKPEWASFAQSVSSQVPGIKAVAMQDTKSRAVLAKFGVTGFPTLVLVDAKGVRHDFTGPRTASAMLAFAKQFAPS
jgi:thiol-disulfide isomerase/thioredoxin